MAKSSERLLFVAYEDDDTPFWVITGGDGPHGLYATYWDFEKCHRDQQLLRRRVIRAPRAPRKDTPMKLRVDLDLVAPESARHQWSASLRDLAAAFPDAVLTVNGDSGSASLAMDDGLPELVAPALVKRVAQDYALYRVQANLGDLPPALRASITEAINNEPSAKESLARLAAAQRCDDIFREQREECKRREMALANRLHAIGKIEPME